MRVGLLGGSFDPIHQGHTELARTAADFLGLDRVVFMVAPCPPHKKGRLRAGSFHRFAMVGLALQNEERMILSTLELERGGPSYTIDLLQEWGQLFPDQEVCFLAGGDSLRQIHLWKDCDKLLGRHSFVFVGRRGSGVELEGLPLEAHLKSRIRVCETPRPQLQPGQSYLIQTSLPPPASSSSIRAALARGETPEYLDPVVLTYIRKHHLYE